MKFRALPATGCPLTATILPAASQAPLEWNICQCPNAAFGEIPSRYGLHPSAIAKTPSAWYVCPSHELSYTADAISSDTATTQPVIILVRANSAVLPSGKN